MTFFALICISEFISLNNVRKDLFDRIYQTPLFDTKQFTNDFCQSLDQMVIEINKNYK